MPKKKLNVGQARNLAGLDIPQFQELLFEKQVYMHYSIEDLEEDIKAIHNR